MKLLDLFCGAGGAAMGYRRAGFDVTGVDIAPMPRYPFAFHQADALAYLAEHGHEYDAIHASPPCQAYSRATAWRGDRDTHPQLIPATRAALLRMGKPYTIETVTGGHRWLQNPLLLCGTALGLRVQRHRYFEVRGAGLLLSPGCCHQTDDYSFDHGAKQTEAQYRTAMGVDWMTVKESRQAIPPAYTEFVGRALMEALVPA